MKNSIVFEGKVSFISVREDRNGVQRIRLGVYQSTPSFDNFGNPAGFVTTLVTGSVPAALADTAKSLVKGQDVEIRGAMSSWSPIERDAQGNPKRDAQGQVVRGFPVMQINITYIGSYEDSTEVVKKAVAQAAAQEEEDDMPF